MNKVSAAVRFVLGLRVAATRSLIGGSGQVWSGRSEIAAEQWRTEVGEALPELGRFKL